MRKGRLLALGVSTLALVLSACGGGSSSHSGTRSSQSAKGSSSATSSQMVTFAEAPGSPPTYIFPLYNGANSGNNNITYLQPLMWRPLYWFGHPNSAQPTVDYQLSLAYPPKLSNGGKTVTIRLRHYIWSDGRPVTTRDVQFWMNLLLANRVDWGIAAPGDWSTHIVKMSYPSKYEFSITFNTSFNYDYLLESGLSQITPIPQHAWDKTSASGPVGNYDLTKSGARAVYKFLNKESLSLKTWDTNPLWQVVDGPYRLKPKTGFQVTGQTIFVANPRYSGPDKPKLKQFEEIPFTSDSAEFNALIAGQVDYGYLPFTDTSQVKRLESQGYAVKPWLDWGFTAIQMNFNNPDTGPIFRQLYIRQAFQHLIDESQIIRTVLHGYGVPTYGPIPIQPSNSFISPQERHDPYPYNPREAVSLLRSHGWNVPAGGVATCVRPGSSSTQCGAGIHAGAKLAFKLDYPSGSAVDSAEVEALRSSFLAGGIQVTATAAPFNQVLSDAYECLGKSLTTCPAGSTQLAWWGSPTWTYVPIYYPVNELFQTGGATNSSGYSNKTNDANGQAMQFSPGLSAVFRWENFLSKQVPMLWFPNQDYQISVLSPRLGGVGAQDSTGHIYPEYWYLKK